jgi:putative tryptophan/tyrosine transport system substrate-binding protein
MQRRDFVKLLGSAAAVWPLAARAQGADHIRRIGVLMSGTENAVTRRQVSALQNGLKSLGWREGQNARIEVSWAGGDVTVMRTKAAELAAWRAEVVVTQVTPATLAFRETTRDVANVFVGVVDPIGAGFAESMSHPGGNSTGFVNFEPTIGGKWLELLQEVAPQIRHVAILFNPKTSGAGQVRSVVQSTAPSFNMTVRDLPISSVDEIEPALMALANDLTTGLLVLPDTSATLFSPVIVQMALRYRLITVYPYRYHVEGGGLLSYGTDLSDLWRKAAEYVDRILKGEKAGDLPVQAPSKYELALNLKTAKALGLTIPPTLLARADAVIE